MSEGRRTLAVRCSVTLALAAVAAFYLWTVSGTPGSLNFGAAPRDYYSLLVEGFQRGHLYLNAAPDPALLALPEGARPGAAPYLLDASLYQGHYYLYFGPVPALLLYWPYAAMTGRALPGAVAALVFALLGTGLATGVWLELRRRLFPRLGAVWTGLAVLALGLGTAVPSTLRHPMFYEAATGAGYAFAMGELWAVLRARADPARACRWLLAAGVACGLAVGSRANLAPAGLLLLALGSGSVARRAPVRRRMRAWAVGLAWAGLGSGACGIGLAAYNVARFGDPLEFGHRYQLGVNPQHLFHVANLEHNLAVYYLTPPALNAYFPFVGPRAEATKPPDYVGREQADGEWIWWPLVLAAGAGAALVARRQSAERRAELGWALALPGALFGVNLLLTGSIGVRSNRYLMDFHPALAVATLVGLGVALGSPSPRVRWGRVLTGIGLMAVVLFNNLASFQVHRFFADHDPAGYDRLARLSDRLVWPWMRWGAPVGDREVTVRWPAVLPTGTREPLLGTGWPTFDDVIWLEYGSDSRARLTYDYDEVGSAPGEWFPIRAGDSARVHVSGALLLPRAGHPWYGSRPEEEQRALKQTLRVTVDGQVRFNRAVPSHDSSPRLQQWGAWRLISGQTCTFSGRLGPVQNSPVDDRAVQAALAADRGAVSLRITLPTDRMGETEPLAQFGAPGRFDLVSVTYVRPGIARLVHDQSSGGADRSAEFAADYAHPHEVVIETPGATDDLDWRESGPVLRGRTLRNLRVAWDGRVVFESTHPPLPGPHPQVVLGVNLVHSSVSRMLFGGELSAGERRTPLGWVTAGSLEFHPPRVNSFGTGAGVLIRFTSAGGDTAYLVWQRNPAGGGSLGWNEADRTIWSKAPWLPVLPPLRIQLGLAGIELERADADSGLHPGAEPLLRAPTDLWRDPPVRAEALLGADWSGGALRPGDGAARENIAPAGAPTALPGIVRIRFRLPAHPLVTGAPLLSAGRVAAADSVYLRQRPDGRFVLGIDHWMFPATESPPFALSDDRVHTALIALGSIAGSGQLGPREVRLSIDQRLVLAREMALYPVRPGEVAIGANPLGMSTSAATFDGEIVSVRTHVAPGSN
jgi:hypothetical protein